MQSDFTNLSDYSYWFGPKREYNDWGSIQIATHINYPRGADGKNTTKGQDQTLLYETTKGGCRVDDEGCIFHAVCVYRTTYAETRINCTSNNGNSCGATQMRRLSMDDGGEGQRRSEETSVTGPASSATRPCGSRASRSRNTSRERGAGVQRCVQLLVVVGIASFIILAFSVAGILVDYAKGCRARRGWR
ncbi:hypothetical protein DBV05_g5364 [Lasiodiplodia theobromae]|uniref:Uncharacterized protein n=1 Tax=Lasiodiplodia theobromae TaxID=45133 RepID=A0A5N5DE00_9PEZI|nr:hypothetical protein DBV05_g5364 [Lasiodiplodia theobromae]